MPVIHITQEHVSTKSALQKKELKFFQEMESNYIGAQVGDVFGANHVRNLYKTTPFDHLHQIGIQAVFFVVGQKQNKLIQDVNLPINICIVQIHPSFLRYINLAF